MSCNKCGSKDIEIAKMKRLIIFLSAMLSTYKCPETVRMCDDGKIPVNTTCGQCWTNEFYRKEHSGDI